ncbi:putative polysaccharide biosynthesis protein [Clostridium sp. DL1XJH146]
MKKQSLIKGTIVLGVAGLFSRFLGIFFRIPLLMLTGDEGMGYYQLAYPMYMFYVALSGGIPLAMSKLISERNALGDEEGIIKVFKEALLLMFVIGLGTSCFMIFYSNHLIKLFSWDNKAYYSLVALGIAPVFIAILGSFRGFFQGLQTMTPTGTSQVLEQIGRVVVGIGLAFILLPRGVEYAAGGATLGAAVGAFVGGFYLVVKYIKLRKYFKVGKACYDSKIMREILILAIPISLGAAVSTVMNLIDSAIVPQRLLQAGFTVKEATILYGQLTGKAAVLVNIPFTLSTALSISIMPIMAETYLINDKKGLIKNINMAFKIGAVIALPSTYGLYFLAKPVMGLVFAGQYGGCEILKYYALAIPFIILTGVTTTILQSTVCKITPVINLLIGCIVKIIIATYLITIPSLNIYGAVISTIGAYIVAATLNMILIKNKLKISINLYETIIKPTYAATFMIIIVLFVFIKSYNLTNSNTISCILSVSLGIIVYGIQIVIFEIFNYAKLKAKLINKFR